MSCVCVRIHVVFYILAERNAGPKQFNIMLICKMSCSRNKYILFFLLLILHLLQEFCFLSLPHLVTHIFPIFPLFCPIVHTSLPLLVLILSFSSILLSSSYSFPLLSPFLSSTLHSLLYPLLSLPTGTSCVFSCLITYYRIIVGIRCEFSDATDTSSNGTGVQLILTINGETVSINLTRETATTGYSFSQIQ